MTLHFYNTLTRQKEPFVPQDASNVRMYVCGPTVYASPHIGNARSVVVYDVLFRLLREVYGESHVTYARNITDVDDKINAAAVERGITIAALTSEVTAEFHRDMAALGCLSPTIEPKATAHMPQIIAMIGKLVAGGHAYVAEGHVLFDVTQPLHPPTQPSPTRGEGLTGADEKSLPPRGGGLGGGPNADSFHWYYGMLSRRSPDDMIAGARVEVAPYKKNPGDFVLWKPAAESDDASSRFESPWSIGRPGWHIECSAMATAHLGENFDLHGGGADLMFPHHENEIAQSCCANPGSHFASTWVHNGFLTVGGEKMSKSLGNFTTVRDLLDQGVHGEVIRFALLSTHYRKPLDWTEKLVADRKSRLDYYAKVLAAETADDSDFRFAYGNDWAVLLMNGLTKGLMDRFYDALRQDMNFSLVNSTMAHVADQALGFVQQNDPKLYLYKAALRGMLRFLGVENYVVSRADEIRLGAKDASGGDDGGEISRQIEARIAAKKEKNWAEADRIRDALKADGILLMDRPDGTTDWQRG